jgi:Ca-activated chloride channel family protein
MSNSIDETKLTAYVLGELSGDELTAFKARLAKDESLRREVETIRGVAGQLQAELAAEALPEAGEIPAPLKMPARHQWGVTLGVAASVLIVGGVAISVLMPRLNRAREVAVRHGEQARTLPGRGASGPSVGTDSGQGAGDRTFAQAGSTAAKQPSDSVKTDVSNLSIDQKTQVSLLPPGAVPSTPAPAQATSPLAYSYQAPAASVPAPASTPLTSVAPAVSVASGDGGVSSNSTRPKARMAQLQKQGTLAVRGSSVNVNSLAAADSRKATESDEILARRYFGNMRPDAEQQRDDQFGVPAQGGNTETYDRIVDNPFLAVAQNPLSTFSIDVDTASYSNMRRFLLQGVMPPKDSVRIEELVNYFPYEYEAPGKSDEKPFAAHVEVAGCPWRPEHRLVRVGLKGKEIAADKRPASNLVFLIDVSGSMQPENKLPLVKRAMRMLADQLGGEDRVAMVVYAGHSGLVLPSTSCSDADKQSILNALDNLEAGGSTNGGQGIQLAYDVAQANFIKGGTNRVILCTDGDFNVGVTNQGDLTRLIEEKAKGGVFLSVLGFGMGNLKDSTMEKLADKGNGNYAYIDTQSEAKKVLVEQMSGTLITIAKDVKIQIEFNPAVVGSYRLIGYENRLLAKEDFNDDKKDAGEIGAGHAVTALYEVEPVTSAATRPTTRALTPAENKLRVALDDAINELMARQRTTIEPGERAALLKRLDQLNQERDALDNLVDPAATTAPAVDSLRYQTPARPTGETGEMLTLKLRYKQPDGEKSALMEVPVKDSEESFAKASGDFKFASAVAAFGMILRDSPNKGSANYSAVREWAEDGLGKDASGYRHEFIDLVKRAEGVDQGQR